MSPFVDNLLFAFGPTPKSGQEPTNPWWTNFVPLVLMIVVFYYILIRPQQKKARDHAEMLKTLGHGDRVVTGGGILGTVVGLKDKSVSIRTSDTKIEVLKSSITEIVEKAASGKSES